MNSFVRNEIKFILRNCNQYSSHWHLFNQARTLSKCSTNVTVLQSYPQRRRVVISDSNFCKLQKTLAVTSLLHVRFNSADATTSTYTADSASVPSDGYVQSFIPEPPTAPEPQVTEELLNALGEPTFSSIGLCRMTPPGGIQCLMENIHVLGDMPWWGTIVIVTTIMRVLIFPIFVIGRKGTINFSNHMPVFRRLNERQQKAQADGDYMEANRLAAEIIKYRTRNELSIFKGMMMPMFQAPIFLSMFWGLRGMAQAPVESFKTGGILWFQDLTLADPYFILPLITSITVAITMEVGTDTKALKTMTPLVRNGLRCVPWAMLIFTPWFPSAILCYWMTNNTLSLCQVAMLKHPYFIKLFNMPEAVVHQTGFTNITMAKAPKGFKPKVRFYKKKLRALKVDFDDKRQTAKKIGEIENRAKMDARRWERAGKSAIVKTYSYDPTKVKGQ